MINDTLQWLAIGALSALLFAMYWSHGMALQAARGTIKDVSGPRVGQRLPDRIVQMLPDPQTPGVVAFISEGCRTCSHLLGSLGAVGNGQRPNLVLVAANPPPEFANALESLEYPVLKDDGDLWRALQISATPFLIYTDGKGRVTSKDVNHVIRSPQ